MPRVGSRVVDSRGLALIHTWIAALGQERRATKPPPDCADETSIQRLTVGDALPAAERDNTILQLLSTTRGALALVSHIHKGALADPVRQRALDLGAESSSPNIRGLFETFFPESQRRVVLGHHILPEVILEHQGDKARGKQIYFSEATQCKDCHAIGEQGKSLGPDLKESVKAYNERPELLSQILDPSAKIAPEYSQYVLVTQEGQAHTGLIVEKTATTVVLKNTDKELIRVPTSDVALLEKQQKSLMPDLLLRDMTAQEAADLLAFLLSIRSEN
jgi:putative heme-binding domain-containing protein